MRSLALAALLACSVTAQDTHTSLGALEKTFAELAGEAPCVAIFAVPGRSPLVLTAGNHGDGTPVTDRSLVALGTTARQLYADALRARHHKRLRGIEALRIGKRKLFVRELLRGSDRVPEFIVWPKGPWTETPTMGAETLTNCIRVGLDADIRFRGWRSTSDLLLLEPILLGPRETDVIAALRIALAPHVPGFDPRDARELGAKQRARILNGMGPGAASTIGAEPQAIRLVVTIKALAAWIDWRRRGPHELIRGARAGSESTLDDYEGSPSRWQHVSRVPAPLTLRAYPELQAMVATSGLENDDTWSLTLAFQEALLGPCDESSRSTDLGLAISERLIDPDVKPLGNTRWFDSKARIAIQSDGKTVRVTDAEGRVLASTHIRQRPDNAWDISLARSTDGTRHRLIVVLDEEPRRLRAVWMHRTPKNGTYPQYLVLEPGQ